MLRYSSIKPLVGMCFTIVAYNSNKQNKEVEYFEFSQMNHIIFVSNYSFQQLLTFLLGIYAKSVIQYGL